MPKVSAQLFAPGEDTGTNTAATRPVYVIIGSGFSAMVNHSTLRWSKWGKARIKGMEVKHIHQGDPWGTYTRHYMGQSVDLLTLPGFSTRLANADGLMRSSEFASLTDLQTTWIKKQPLVEMITGRVTSIKRAKKAKFLIKYLDIQDYPRQITADYVDLCPGPGEMRLTERTGDKKTANNFDARPIWFDDVLYKEYQKTNPPPAREVRRVIGAQLYMHQNVLAGVAKACVFGTGPLAASCVERALQAGADEVYWVAKTPLNPSFAPGLRYDDLARMENGDPLPRRRAPVPDKILLIPARTNVKFAEGYKVAQVQMGSRGRIALKFVSGDPGSGRKRPRFVDRANPREDKLKDLEFDQLIISASNQAREDESGSPAYLSKDIRDSDGGKLQIIKPVPSDNKVPGIGAVTVGVRTKDGKFRILGTAGLTHFDRGKGDKEDPAKPSRLRLWELSLPAQALVNLVGVTISAAAVAQANGFFQKNPNDCVNIAHTGELWFVWGNENGLVIYNARRQRVDPFSKNGQGPDDKDYPLPRIEGGHYAYRLPEEYWP